MVPGVLSAGSPGKGTTGESQSLASFFSIDIERESMRFQSVPGPGRRVLISGLGIV